MKQIIAELQKTKFFLMVIASITLLGLGFNEAYSAIPTVTVFEADDHDNGDVIFSTLDTTLVGSHVVDLNWDEKDRLVRVYAEFTNFDIRDGYFNMNIIQSSTGNTVASSEINVYSTSDGKVDFNSFVLYMVNDRDICSYDMSDAEENVVCSDVITGDYEFKVTTLDSAVSSSEIFFIIDTRN